MGSYGNTGMCFYSTQYSLFWVSQSLQLLLHLFYHHGEWGFSMCCQVCSSQFWYSGAQAFRVLLCQNRRDTKNTTGLGKTTWKLVFFFLTEMIVIVELPCDSIPYLKESGGIADNVGELENVGSELLLHVTKEKHCILGGEPTNTCHCKNKVTWSNL